MKLCTCGTKFSHPTRDKCSRCSGWSCVKCGRPKPAMNGKEMCDRVECNKVEKVKRKRSREGVSKKKTATTPSNVRTIAERRADR